MKKNLSILTAISMTTLVATSVVSCVAPRYAEGEAGQRIILATESGKINDHSFNEDAYRGMNTYLKNEYGIDGKNNYVEAADASYTAITTGYRLARLKKADALVLPGFAHVNTVGEATKLFKNKSIVLIDGKPVNENNPETKNVISIVFNSQIASMQAVFDAAYWATTLDPKTGKMNGDVNNDGKITIAPFGGVSFKYAVDNYLWGSFLGMELFNQYYAQTEPSRKVYLANNQTHEVKDLKISSATDTAYYSGNFQLGGATKSGIISNLIDTQKADIIFPIAGSQIEDVLAYQPRSSDYHQLPYVVGVDVDQATAYDSKANHGRFITSATKNIHGATYEALKHASSLKDKVGEQLVDRTDPTKLWDGSSPTPFINWSVALVDQQTKNGEWAGLYKVQKHKLYLYDTQNDSNDEKGALPPDDTNILVNAVNEAFNQTGNKIEQYMDGLLIQKIAREIVTRSQQKLFPLVHQD